MIRGKNDRDGMENMSAQQRVPQESGNFRSCCSTLSVEVINGIVYSLKVFIEHLNEADNG